MTRTAPTRTEPTEPITAAPAFLTREEVMTAREVADLLRMPTSTVYELARKGVLPASQLGPHVEVPAAAAGAAAGWLMRNGAADRDRQAYAACSGWSDSSDRSNPESSIATGGASPSGGAR